MKLLSDYEMNFALLKSMNKPQKADDLKHSDVKFYNKIK